MQETSVQLVGRQQMQAMQAATQAATAATAAMADGALSALDPFSMIILSMMQNSATQDGTPQDGTPQQIVPGDPQQDERTLAQNAAELLLAGQMVPMFTELPDAQVPAAEETQASAVSMLNLQPMALQTPVSQAAVMVQTEQPQSAAPEFVMPDATAVADAEEQAAQPQMVFSMEMQPQSGESESSSPQFTMQSESRQTFDSIADKPEQTDKKTQTQTLDIDALQAQADARRTQLETQIRLQPVQKQETGTAESVSRQVTQQIQQNLTRGNSEFTMRLKPEELGEITVRLVEKAGKMTLQISAASAQTVKLLNEDLAALREAVRPMQVEVREAVVETQSQDGAHLMQSFDLGGQFFGNPQQTMSQSQTARSSDGDFGWPLEDAIPADPEQTAQAARIVTDNLLDIYL